MCNQAWALGGVDGRGSICSRSLLEDSPDGVMVKAEEEAEADEEDWEDGDSNDSGGFKSTERASPKNGEGGLGRGFP